MSVIKYCFLLAALLLSSNVSSSECYQSPDAVTPSSRYQVSGQGIVTDTQTGLTWMRCPMGMEWTGAACKNTPDIVNWSRAKILMLTLNHDTGYAGIRDWRLPTLEELNTLVEKKCFEPAINSEIFPGTPHTGFWTSTEDKGFDDRAWLVYFRHGSQYMGNKEQEWAVRAVRRAD